MNGAGEHTSGRAATQVQQKVCGRKIRKKSIMPNESQQPDAQRIENLLNTSEYFRPAATRRKFITRMLAVGGGVAVGGVIGGEVLRRNMSTHIAHAAPADGTDPVTAFGNAAVGAERIATAFYSNALGVQSQYGVAADVAKGRLLNSGDRVYFQGAQDQEQQHENTLASLGLRFPYSVFAFPSGTFDSATAMLAFGEKLEDIFIGAYLGAIKVAATASNAFIAEAAAQIVGVECEHRVLIRGIEKVTLTNDRVFEGNLSSNGSTVYASANDAVNALLALGITPVK